MSKASKGWRRFGEALLLIVIIFLAHAYAARGTLSGDAPELSGVAIGGRPVSLDALRGKPVLVYFWATWCPVCAMEQGSIVALAGSYPVVAVAMDDTSEVGVRRYMAAHSVDYPVLHDPDSAVGARWGVRGVPATFIIDAHGRIAFREVGYRTGIGLRLRLWWASL